MATDQGWRRTLQGGLAGRPDVINSGHLTEQFGNHTQLGQRFCVGPSGAGVGGTQPANNINNASGEASFRRLCMRRTLNSLFRACSLHLTLLMNAVSLTGRLLSALRLFRLLVRCFIGGKEEKESGPSRNCGRITSGGFNVDSEPFPLDCGGDAVADSGQARLSLVKKIPTKIRSVGRDGSQSLCLERVCGRKRDLQVSSAI